MIYKTIQTGVIITVLHLGRMILKHGRAARNSTPQTRIIIIVVHYCGMIYKTTQTVVIIKFLHKGVMILIYKTTQTVVIIKFLHKGGMILI